MMKGWCPGYGAACAALAWVAGFGLPPAQAAAQQPGAPEAQQIPAQGHVGQAGPPARLHAGGSPQPQALNSRARQALDHPITVVFVNASAGEWIPTLTAQSGVPITLDDRLQASALPPLTVVARQTPAYLLLLQIAEAEGLGFRAHGSGIQLYGLPRATYQNDMKRYLESVSKNGVPQVFAYNPGSPSPGAAAEGQLRRPALADVQIRVGTGPPSADVSASAEGAQEGYTSGAGGFGGLKAVPQAATGPGFHAFAPRAPLRASPGIARPSAGVGPTAQQAFAGALPQPFPIPAAPAAPAGQAHGPNALQAPSAAHPNYPTQATTTPPIGSEDLNALLAYAIRYINAPEGSMALPERMFPFMRLTTSDGSLQYLGVVMEAFTQPGVTNPGSLVSAQARFTRFQALLKHVESLHQAAGRRETLQIEALVLQARLPDVAPSIKPYVNNLIQKCLQGLAHPSGSE